ncbi:PilZ domain-containing protein [Sphingomonas gilva]|uniref:PilZ domain-containing protein n=1 Tax=Sphingomonas gilva TaxID=2305907 RepID=A0A396RLF0_9SPHN|nr:PilZ domain-containing protein [Sphingomonas gilva]RHW17138.1 PilZ domain-containing protein [Sphingomonas gilva]
MNPISKSESRPDKQRSQRRDSLLLRAEIRSLDGHDPIAAVVRNLSAGGMMAENAFVYPVDTRVEVELRNMGSVPGKVVWRVENRMGIAFDWEINPAAARKPVLKTSNPAPKRAKPIRPILE